MYPRVCVGFRGRRAWSSHRWATDWRRHSRYSWYLTNVDRSAVKHGTHNIQNDATNDFPTALERQIRFSAGAPPGPCWGSFIQRSPARPLGLRGLILREGKEKGGGEGARRERGNNGRDRPPYANSWIRPWPRIPPGFVVHFYHWNAGSTWPARHFVVGVSCLEPPWPIWHINPCSGGSKNFEKLGRKATYQPRHSLSQMRIMNYTRFIRKRRLAEKNSETNRGGWPPPPPPLSYESATEALICFCSDDLLCR